MGLRGLTICISLTVMGLAILGYQRLPDGVENPFITQVVMSYCKLLQHLRTLKAYLGYGGYYSNVKQGYVVFVKDIFLRSFTYGDFKVTMETIAGVPVRVYQPKTSSQLHPAIVFFHGGGWVSGSADVYDRVAYAYALQTGASVFSVDYRQPPEHPFPAPLEDCIDVTRFILKHGAQYNVDVGQVGVAGDSAGGNLAAAVSLNLSRDSELPRLRFQVLHYPAMQALDMLLPSYIDINESMPILTQGIMAAFYAYYMGVDEGQIDHYTYVMSQNRHVPPDLQKSKFAEYVDVKLLPNHYQQPKKPRPVVAPGYDAGVYAKLKDVITDPMFSPLMAEDLSGLPPALVYVCEFDVLRDDGFLYARRLQEAGVKAQIHFSKGAAHGELIFAQLIPLSTGRAAMSAASAFIKETLGV